VSSSERIVEVAVPVAQVTGTLSYRVPARFADRAVPGVRVKVTVARRPVVGVILREGVHDDARSLLQVQDVLDDTPVLTDGQRALVEFVSRYYLAPIGDAVRLALPHDTPKDVAALYKLTADGLKARVFAAAHGLSAKDTDVLAAFSDDEWKSNVSLRGKGATPARLRALVEKGLLESKEATGARAPREDPLVVACEGGQELPKRSAALASIDAAVRVSTSPMRLSELSVLFPDARGKIARLVTLGRMQLHERVKEGALAGLSRKPLSTLTEAQRACVARVVDVTAGAFLLEGVTGSGKTEVYLAALQHTLAEGRGAILVVPEIALTPQLIGRVSAVVGGEIAVLHSGLSSGERRDAFFRLLRREVRVAVGARSVLFAPVPDVGLIVVDEEHDGALKQEESPRYHGRDVALWRGKNEGARVILGSATPSLESVENAREGRFVHLTLPERIGGEGALPVVTVVDLRDRKRQKEARRRDREPDDGVVVLSGPLREAMQETLANGEQVLLFLNRRGFASVLLCTSCGHIEECPQCSVALTVHAFPGEALAARLMCHQCDHEGALFSTCRPCGGEMLPLGLGTERIETVVKAAFPEARVARLDRDTTKHKGSLERILRAVQARDVDVLIGTQMVAKGHDFPGIALVGVVLADVALALPDFRASERAFSLLTQVAGRAGRGSARGRVIVQTYNPEHPAVRFAQTHDVTGFLAAERAARKEHQYPPFSRLAVVRVEGEDATAVDAIARRVGERVRAIGREKLAKGSWDVLGPAPATLERLRGKTRHQVLVRARDPKSRALLLEPLVTDVDLHRAAARAGCRLVLDVDPIGMV
jgi:primosomal protein N' (replication factor Y)